MLPAYSIVIPAYNEEAHLPATLASAHAAMRLVPEAGEVVVVDNNSTDRTAAVAAELGARVIFEPVNQISRARNAGARAASGQWLVFLDADTRLPPGLLVRALENLRSGKIAGGGALMVMDEPMPARFRRMVNLWTFVSRHLQLASGSFLYCTREGFEAVGGFSLKYYASEDVVFSQAFKKWARRRGDVFCIIENPPVQTSARKIHWYSTAELAGFLLIMVLCPWTMRSKRFCAYWYRRPGKVSS